MKKRVLYVSHRTPFPPTSGGAVKRWRLVQHLASRYELGLAFLHGPGDAGDRDALQARIRTRDFLAQPVDRPRSAANLLRSQAAGLPLSVFRNVSARFSRDVADVSAGYDVLFLDSCLVSPCVPDDFAGRIVLHAHNAEHVLLSQFARLTRMGPAKLVALTEAARMRRFELQACRRANRILAAPGDRDALAALGVPATKFTETMHLGDEQLLERPDPVFEETGRRLLFVGSLGWEPNVDGLAWFIRGAWPRLRERFPDLGLHIVGARPDKRLLRLSQSRAGIELTGFVDDLEPYYRGCRVFVAPTRMGSGMSVKIVNAMCRGIPVVTTANAAATLGVPGGQALATGNDPESLARNAVTVLDDRTRWTSLRDSSRRFAREKFSWELVFSRVDEAIGGSSSSIV